MDVWVRFFLGTPRRFCTTAIALALVVVIFNPCLLSLAVARLLTALMPVTGPAMMVVIIVVALRMIGGGGRKH